MKKYSHFISLGFFCSVALELERLGLRSASYPFDWCISDFKGVIQAIDSHFDDFLKYDDLSQNMDIHEQYKNDKYNIYFFHDFDRYLPLEEQISTVKVRYDRRIERFYKNISEPTIFIRYISDKGLTEDGKTNELDWIENNYDKIIMLLKSFNSDNDIIFIANQGVSSHKIKIYSVEKDKNDSVSRKFLDKNKELFSFLTQFEFPLKKSNILRFENKEKNRKSIIKRSGRKIKLNIKKIFLKEYIHNKQY